MGEALIDQLEELVDALTKVEPHDLADGLLLQSQERLLKMRRRLDGVLARRLQVMDARDVTTEYCARSTKAWLIEDQLMSRPAAGGLMAVARSYVSRSAIVESLLAGDIGLDHAKTVVGFLPKLPDLDAREQAEKLLLEAAKETDPTTMTAGLRQLADQLCLDETAEERAVRRHEGRYLTFTDTIDGMVKVDGMLDAPFGKVLKKAVEALAQRAGEVDERTVTQRKADALVELARLAMNRGELPDTAGEPTQVHVATDLDDLTRRLQAGEIASSTLDGTPITPNTVRMLACDAGIIPVVMGGASEVLDLGRSTRTWSRAQRKAAKLRDGGCVFPGCQAPIDRCDLHHIEHWANGGPTDHHNGGHVCNYHHWLVHHTDWTITRNKDGTIEVRRT